MPSKSRRNRRSLPNKNITGSTVAAATTTSASTAQEPTSYSRPARAATTATLGFPYFGRDLRWSGIVTAIVIVLLVIAYIVFR